MTQGGLDRLIRDYIERVVNQHDMEAVDDLVSTSYTGSGYGWPETIEALRAFYDRQDRTRPDWRIDIQGTLEVGEWIAVRAIAAGKQAFDEDGSPLSPPYLTSVEWLTVYHVVESKIVESRIISVVDHSMS